MDEKVKVQGHERAKPKPKEGHEIAHTDKIVTRGDTQHTRQRGVRRLSRAPEGGVRTESKAEGGSLETTVELGGPGTQERDMTGRRVFDS